MMPSAPKNIFVGNFGQNTSVNGQVVKTKYVYAMLSDLMVLETLDVSSWARIFKTLFFVGRSNFYVLLGKKGIVLFCLLSIFSFRVRQRTFHFILVGGWFPEYLAGSRLNTFLFSRLKYRATFYCESAAMCQQLEKLGFSGKYFPNFRNLNSIPLKGRQGENLKLVFLSRVTKDKGVFDAIALAKKLALSRPCTLDIYGPGEQQTISRLEMEIHDLDNIQYSGVINPEKIQTILADYDFLIFPTRYPGECMPGVLVEAFSVGLPVLTTDWRFMQEYVDHDETGYVISTQNFVENAAGKLVAMTDDDLQALRKNAIHKYEQFYSSKVASQYFRTAFGATTEQP